MSIGAYAFLAFEDPEQLLPAVDLVRSTTGVLYWHAIEGHYHLAIAADTAEAAAALRSLPGLADAAVCTVANEVISAGSLSSEHTHAYISMEIAPDAQERLLGTLTADGGPQWSMLAATDCGIIGVLSAESFDAVDRTIDSAVRPLDGVLRLKRDWIIDLTQL
jgi:hypothetical protein